MKPKWNNEEIKKLFDIIDSDQNKNIPTLESFRKFAKLTNRNALSVRNFYYQYVKYLKANPKKAIELGVDIKNFEVQHFKHFDKEQEEKLQQEVNKLLKNGYSIRKACEMISDGTISDMLRIQNKYRSLQKKQTAKVIQFPSNTSQTSGKLSDDDIKSLFMGLVKLVKESAHEDSKTELKNYIKQYEKHKLQDVVALKQKDTEIAILKNQIADLKQKNRTLNEKLTDYRIKFINESTDLVFDR